MHVILVIFSLDIFSEEEVHHVSEIYCVKSEFTGQSMIMGVDKGVHPQILDLLLAFFPLPVI